MKRHVPSATLPEDTVLSIRGVGKKFCRGLRRSMAYGIVDLTRNLLGVPGTSDELRRDEFWAINNVSFDLRRGEVLGLIGANGCGKTTLLRLLANIFPPDKGEIVARGRIGALIALGAGFHPHMTGRENIYLNGTILGMRRTEIEQKLQWIQDFAEIGEFIDAPVATYSSGMRVRLGFAVAVSCEPDILLVDEVLAVGDVGFRAKCYNHIATLMQRSAVIFVSHSMSHINRYCGRVLVLHKGQSIHLGDTGEGIDTYLDQFKDTEGSILIETDLNHVDSFELLNAQGEAIDTIRHSGLLRIRLSCAIDPSVSHPIVGITFLNREMQLVAVCRSSPGEIENRNGRLELEVEMGPFLLNPADYKISLTIHDDSFRHILIWYNVFWRITVTGETRDYGSTAVHFVGEWRSGQDARPA